MVGFPIPVERLTEGVEIQIIDTFYGPDSRPAEVMAVEFDGEGYLVKSRLIESNGNREWVGDQHAEAYYLVGSTVEHCYEHEPRWMRSRAAVTAEEWQALEEAMEMEE